MQYNDAQLAALDASIKKHAGEHYETLKAEYVDWHNDLRVASVRDITDLGVPYEVADAVLYITQELARTLDPNMRQMGEIAAGPEVVE